MNETEKKTPEASGGELDFLGVLQNVETQLSALKKAHAEREAFRQEMEKQSRALDERHRAIAEAERNLAELGEELRARRQEVDSRQAALQEAEARCERDLNVLSQESERISAAQKEVAERQQALTKASRDQERAVAQWKSRVGEYEQLLAKLEEAEILAAERGHEILQRQDEALALARKLEEVQASIRHSSAIAEQRLTRMTQDRDRLAIEVTNLAGLIEEKEQRIDELTRRIAESAKSGGQGEVDRQAQIIKRLEGELAGARQTPKADPAELEALRQELRQNQDTRKALEEQVASLRAEASSNQTDGRELAGIRERLAEASERVAVLEIELEESRSAAEELRLLREQHQNALNELRASHARLEKAEANNMQLGNDMDDLHGRFLALQSRAGSGDEARRARLRAVRTELGRRRAKLDHATTLVRERYAQCEEVLKTRAAVIEAKRKADAAARRAAKKAARHKTGVFMLAMAASIAIIAGISWVATDKLIESSYTATAIVKAESRTGVLSERNLAEWQTYHEGLIDDPGFLTLTSGRLAKRGIISLATPADLREYLKQHLDVDSSADGELRLVLSDLGRQRTQMVLETFVTALASRANSARDMRSDGGHTVIVQEPLVGAAPIEDKRVMYAGAGAAGGSLLLLVIGSSIYVLLSKSKQKFDAENEEKEAMLEVEFGDLDPGREAA